MNSFYTLSPHKRKCQNHLSDLNSIGKHLDTHMQLSALKRNILVDNILILKTFNCKRYLEIIESLYINWFMPRHNLDLFEKGKMFFGF